MGCFQQSLTIRLSSRLALHTVYSVVFSLLKIIVFALFHPLRDSERVAASLISAVSDSAGIPRPGWILSRLISSRVTIPKELISSLRHHDRLEGQRRDPLLFSPRDPGGVTYEESDWLTTPLSKLQTGISLSGIGADTLSVHLFYPLINRILAPTPCWSHADAHQTRF